MSQSPEDPTFELQAAERAERARLLSRRIEQASTVAESPGGEVRVTIDSTGGLAGRFPSVGDDEARSDRR